MSFLNKMGSFDAVSLGLGSTEKRHWVYLKRVPITQKDKNVTTNNEEVTAWVTKASVTPFNSKKFVYQVQVSSYTYNYLAGGTLRTTFISAGQTVKLTELGT